MMFFTPKDKSIVFVLTLMSGLASCADVFDPHKNFVNTMNGQIGRTIDGDFRFFWCSERRPDLTKVTNLPNSNIEHRYRYQNARGTCEYVCEVNPATRTTVGWRFVNESTQQACIVIP